MNRSHSLMRLLNSLQNGKYEQDIVNMEIFVDAMPNTNTSDGLTKTLLQNFEWSFGSLFIEYNKYNFGLKRQWLRKYKYSAPLLILEDDLELSFDFYRIAKQSIRYVNSLNNSKILGISLHQAFFALQRKNCPYFLPQKCLKKFPELKNSSFFAPIMSTWAPIVFSGAWNQLVDYSNYFFNLKNNLPCIPGAITNLWLDTSGTFMQYYLYIKSMFLLYLHIDYDLVFHHREMGLHFKGTEPKKIPKFYKFNQLKIFYNTMYVFDHAYNQLNNGLSSYFNQSMQSITNKQNKCYVR